MKGLTLLTLSEMSDPTFLTLGSVSPFTFVSPWLLGVQGQYFFGFLINSSGANFGPKNKIGDMVV